MPIAKATFTIRDAKNALSKTSIYIDVPDLITDEDESPYAFAQAYAGYLDALIDGAIIGIHVSATVSLPDGIKSTPVANADVEAGAHFTWECANGALSDQTIPSFSEDYFNPDGSVKDYGLLSLPEEFFNFLLIVENPSSALVGSWNLDVTSIHGEDIVRAPHVYQTFKKSPKIKT